MGRSEPRFPAGLTGPIKIFHKPEEASFLTPFKPHRAFQIYEDWSAISAIGSPEKAGFECFPAGTLPDDAGKLFSPEFLEGQGEVEPIEMDREAVLASIGLDAAGGERVQEHQAYRGQNLLVIVWKTADMDHLFARRFDGEKPRLVLTTRFQSLEPMVPTLDLDDPDHELFHW